MLEVNFIADPWEWRRDSRLYLSDPFRDRAYREFKSRLHWLLLWYDKVLILDTFVLFNRQIERWVEEVLGRGGDSKRALERLLGNDQAIRVRLRNDPSCSTLTDIDAKHVRGNNGFVWYPDGPPKESFLKVLDEYFPTHTEDTYSIADHREKMCHAFEAATSPHVEPTDDGYEVYREFEDLRKMLLPHPKVVPALRDQVDGQWHRSTLYKVLGYGLDKNRGRLRPQIDISSEARNRLRELSDHCYHQAINHDLKSPSRFPGQTPPASFELLFPNAAPGSILVQAEESLKMRSEFFERDVGKVCLNHDVEPFFRELGELSLEKICELRLSSQFREFRERYAEFERAGESAWNNQNLLREIVARVVPCMQLAGCAVGVSVERTHSSAVRVGFAIVPVARRLVAWGLAVHISPTPGREIPDFVVDEALRVGGNIGLDSVRWLAARFRRGTPSSGPIRLTLNYHLGGVITSNKAD